MNNTVSIKRWGNSQGIMLSKKLLSSIGIDDPLNQEVTINIEDNKLIVEKKSSQSRLMKRFQNYDYQDYLNDKNRVSDKGQPVGRELW